MTIELDGQCTPLRLPLRFPVHLPVDVTVAGGPPQTGRVVNLTRTGLFIATSTPAAVGARVGLVFSLPLSAGDRRVAAAAEVRWVNGGQPPRATTLPPGMGLQFVRLEPEVRETLDAFLTERLAALTQGVGHPVAAWPRPVLPKPCSRP